MYSLNVQFEFVSCCNDDVLISSAKEPQTDQQTAQSRLNEVGVTVRYNLS